MDFGGNNIIKYLVGLIPISAYLLKVFIDNWGATNLEKIMMSNLKRFQVGLTKYILIGIASGVFFSIYLTIFPLEGMKDVESFIFPVVVIFISITSTFFLLEKFLVFAMNIFSFKFDYYILNDEDVPVFRVIKNSGKNHLLVESNDIEEFIENPRSKRYKKIRRENDKLRRFYQGRQTYVILSSIYLICVALFVGFLKTTLWIQFILYLLFVSLLCLFFILLFIFVLGRRAQQQ